METLEQNWDEHGFRIATRIQMQRSDAKLLAVGSNRIVSTRLHDLTEFMKQGDVLVVNDSATIPASLQGHLGDRPVELRLATNLHPEFGMYENWRALIFDTCSMNLPTEKRTVPPVERGDQIYFSRHLVAEVIEIETDRLIKIRFFNNVSIPLIRQIFEIGKPIQYSYMRDRLEVYDQQTIFAGTPASVEPPSAAFQFTWGLVNRLKKRGVVIVPITHSAGISSTGSKEQDQMLPFEEKYRISSKAAETVNVALEEESRVIALGTTVVRALESAVVNGRVMAGISFTSLKIDRWFIPQVVLGIITGMHVPNESHMQILEAFSNNVEAAYNRARMDDFLWHEYGDVGFFTMDTL